jgi:hypothetical protein
MKSTANYAASDPFERDRNPVFAGDPSLDVPDMLAGRIGDLYASYDRSSRRERTNRLLRQAAEAEE